MLQTVLPSCTSRHNTAIMLADSTYIYPSKTGVDVEAKISLSNKAKSYRGKAFDEQNTFIISDKSKVKTVIDLQQLPEKAYEQLMFHIDWIGPDGKSIYTKQINIDPLDSIKTIKSSISATTEKRVPGKYKLKLYYFRELIAEKNFRLINEADAPLKLNKRIETKLDLYSGTRSKLKESTNTFNLNSKEKLRANLQIINPDEFINEELAFRFEWMDSAGKTFYKKSIKIAAGENIGTLQSAISLDPDKRSIGEYYLNVYLFKSLLGSTKHFELLPEIKTKTIRNKLKATITLCSSLDKKTGNCKNIGTRFSIKEKAKVNAKIEINNLNKPGNQSPKLRIEWIGINGKTFYKKKIKAEHLKSGAFISSAISIPPGKRKAGTYQIRVYNAEVLLAKQLFVLE